MDVKIIWASDSGNSQMLADDYAAELSDAGFNAESVDMADFSAADLSSVNHLLICASTWGDGDPPSNAFDFAEEFFAATADLSSLNYAVLALGDSNYPKFCNFGKNLDEHLEKCGAKKMLDRVDCDIDYEDPAANWFAEVKSKLEALK